MANPNNENIFSLINQSEDVSQKTTPPETEMPSGKIQAPAQENVFSLVKKNEESNQQENGFDLPQEESDEDFFDRNVKRMTFRFGEQLVGAPGNIRDFITGLLGTGVEQIEKSTDTNLTSLKDIISGKFFEGKQEGEKENILTYIRDLGLLPDPGILG